MQAIKARYIILLVLVLAGASAGLWFLHKTCWDINRPISERERTFLEHTSYLRGEWTEEEEELKTELAARYGLTYMQLSELSVRELHREIEWSTRETCGLPTESYWRKDVFTETELAVLREAEDIEDRLRDHYWPKNEKLRARYGISDERYNVLLEKRKAEILAELEFLEAF